MDTETVGRLRAVISKLSRQLNASAAGEGLTPSQASALGLIAGRGPLSLTELASLEGLNPTMLSRIVGKLDDARLIRRVQNPNDLRSANVEITEDGRMIHELIRSEQAAVVSQCVARLPTDQQELLAASLPALEALVTELKHRARPADG
jgi:DNA-binding MarR family transcriptional regulator